MARKKTQKYPVERQYTPPNIPHKLYKTVLLDCPWKKNQTGRLGAAQHYPLLTIDEIKRMPIPDLLDESAFVFLWVPNSLIMDGCEVLEHWGLRVVSVLTWWKLGRLSLGYYYFRNVTEQLIVGVKGKAKFKFHSQPSILVAPAQEHSHKPEELYPILERLGEGNRLECFARRKTPGWDIWGDSVPSDVFMNGFPVPSYSFDPATRHFFDNKEDTDDVNSGKPANQVLPSLPAVSACHPVLETWASSAGGGSTKAHSPNIDSGGNHTSVPSLEEQEHLVNGTKQTGRDEQPVQKERVLQPESPKPEELDEENHQ